jgi:hypothetical protein
MARCEYTDGRGRCRREGPYYHFAFLRPQVIAQRAMTASNVYRAYCLKHFRKMKQ